MSLFCATKKHIPIATLSEEIQDRTITLMSPAKTFNVADINCGFAVIPNPDIRKRFVHIMHSIAPLCVNVLGLTACQAAYSDCEQWRNALLKYLTENKKEATYLA